MQFQFGGRRGPAPWLAAVLLIGMLFNLTAVPVHGYGGGGLPGLSDSSGSAGSPSLPGSPDPADASDGTVTVAVEKFTLGQGYYTEPVQAPFTAGEGQIIARVLGSGNYNNGADEENIVYLANVRDSDTEVDIPRYIIDAVHEAGETIGGRNDDEWLGEFDYTYESGWMYAVNHEMAEVGMAQYPLSDGDVIRLSFTVFGYGRDLGFGYEDFFTGDWLEPYIEVADKDELTALVAAINSAPDKQDMLDDPAVAAAYGYAYEILTDMESSQDETDGALEQLLTALADWETPPVEIYKHTPAPGQFINQEGWGLNKGATLEPNAAGVSLGAFGGSITFKFNEPIKNDPRHKYGVDFLVYGNAFAGWEEPGAIMVAQDKDGDGVPDEWYEIAHSEYYSPETLHGYVVTYTNPDPTYTESLPVPWTDNYGNSGEVPVNNFHKQPYYPMDNLYDDVDPETLTLSGTIAAVKKIAFGAADVHPNGPMNDIPRNPYVASPQAAAIDISWAVDENHDPVYLDEISFVKVYTAVQMDAGSLGEVSTEVTYITEVAPEPEPVGITPDLDWIEVDGVPVPLEPGLYTYDISGEIGADAIRVEVGTDAENVFINSVRGTDADVELAEEGPRKIRIIAQTGEREPVIYMLNFGADDGGGDPDPGWTREQIEAFAGKIAERLQELGDGLGEWQAFGLARGGHHVPPGYAARVEDYIRNANHPLRLVTEYERYVLALTALGLDPTDFGGENLVEHIYDHENFVMQGLNGPIFGLLAVDGGDFEIPPDARQDREYMLDYILERQKDDGGFNLSDGASRSDVDITAMALQALAKHPAYEYGGKTVAQVIDEALTWLEGQQQPSGAFINWYGQENAESTAQVMVTLTELGIGPDDERFTEEDGDVLAGLLKFALPEEGGFSHLADCGEGEYGCNLDSMATEQGFYALAAYLRWADGKTTLFDMTDVAPAPAPPGDDDGEPAPPGDGGGEPAPPAGTVTLSVEKPVKVGGHFFPPASVEIAPGDTAFTVLLKTGLDVDYRGSGASLYVEAIEGLGEFDRGPESGWMYQVNGEFPMFSAGIYELNDGDVVRWRYTDDLGRDIGNEWEGDGGPGQTGGGEGAPGSLTRGQIKEAIAKTAALVEARGELSDWEALALARAGGSVPADYLARVEETVREREGAFRKVTDYERIVLALTAIGADPREVAGYDLVERIYNNENMTMQGINGPVFALIALDSGGYEVPAHARWTRARLLDHILDRQHHDGSFSLTDGAGSRGDVDITAMVLQALAAYRDDPRVEEAIEKAAAWLADQQLTGGAFLNFDGEANAESTAQVLIALTALNVSPHGPLFHGGDGDVIDGLMSFLMPEGGFSHVAGDGANPMATEQGLMALVAYDRWLDGKPALFDMVDRPGGPAVEFADAGDIAPWARDAVAEVRRLGLMHGTGGLVPRFEPRRVLSRAELAAVLVRWRDLAAQDGENGSGGGSSGVPMTFTDVGAGDWFYAPVSRAAGYGWVQGIGEGFFDPAGQVTREQVAVILARLKGLEGGGGADDSALPADLADASPWAAHGVRLVYEAGLMVGDGGFFRPRDVLTREMAAVLLLRLIQADLPEPDELPEEAGHGGK